MASKEWKKYKIEDISNINATAYSSSEKWEYVNYLDTGNITKNKIDTIQYIDLTIDKLPSRAKRKVIKNSIIYSTVRPNQQHFGFIDKQPKNFLVSTGFAVIDVRPDIAIPKFVYYYLTQDKITEGLHAIAEQSVSAYPSIKPSDIGNVKIVLPDLPTQEKIARILSSLDDKIELNNKINQNLEQQAQAIFKSWFVNFEPFGGKMPDDWRIGKLEELTQIKSGKRPQLKQADKDDNFSIPIIGASTIMGYTNAILYNEPILITGRVGTHGIINKYNKQCWPSDNTLVIKSKYYEYIYQQLKRIDFAGLNRGSTQPLITQKDLLDIDVVIPTSQKAKEYEQFATQLSIYQDNLITEKEKLTQLRDTLLPKLMNGEIDVDKVEV